MRTEFQVIEVTTLGEDPSRPMTVEGRWHCPSLCDPAYRRWVIAENVRSFEVFCRERGWNPARVGRIHDRGHGIEVMGCSLRADMVHMTVLCGPSPHVWGAVSARIERQPRPPSASDRAYWRPTDPAYDAMIPSRLEEPEEDQFRWGDAMRWAPRSSEAV